MITMENVCKSYKVAKRNAGLKEACKSLFRRETESIRALSDVSFTIQDGEMVGYIGPNGAGKSSTIKILSGILTPDSGSCVIDGRIPWKNRMEHVKQIGVVFGQRSQLWWDIPVIDSFELLKEIYSISTPQYHNSLEELTELLQLKELLRTPTRQLSLGQRMRCEIAASLLHQPRLLFLDEPTIGLDAVSKLAVRDFIRKQNQEHNTTVILTTHDMQDIEALTNRVILIGRGKVLLDGTLEDMRAAAQKTSEEFDVGTEMSEQYVSIRVDRGYTVDGICCNAGRGGREGEHTESDKNGCIDSSKRETQSNGMNLDQIVADLYQKLDIL